MLISMLAWVKSDGSLVRRRTTDRARAGFRGIASPRRGPRQSVAEGHLGIRRAERIHNYEFTELVIFYRVVESASDLPETR